MKGLTIEEVERLKKAREAQRKFLLQVMASIAKGQSGLKLVTNNDSKTRN